MAPRGVVKWTTVHLVKNYGTTCNIEMIIYSGYRWKMSTGDAHPSPVVECPGKAQICQQLAVELLIAEKQRFKKYAINSWTDLPSFVSRHSVDVSLSIRRSVHRQHSSCQLSLPPNTNTHHDTRASTPCSVQYFYMMPSSYSPLDWHDDRQHN